MNNKKSFLDRFSDRVDDVDPSSRQAYILRILREKGFLEAVFNTIEEGILVVDAKLKIRYFNRAARQLLALPEDWENIRISRLFPSLDWRHLLSGDEASWAHASRQEIEILYPEHRFLQFYLAPLPEDAGLAAILLNDVTGLRRESIAEVEEGASNAVSMLAAEVAHEIGNPLNSLYLNLQLLEESHRGNMKLSEDDKASMVSDCRHEVERLDGIIRRFLQAVDRGKMTFELLDVRQLIIDTLNFMKIEIENRNIEIKCVWPEELPGIQGNADSLKQAFYNIIRNAFQAMPSGGSLTIKCSAGPEYFLLEFQDSGSGVDGEEMREIFKPFKSFKPGGHGIGMMIIERVCREHGAEFGVSSDAKTGTTIAIRFPLSGRIRKALTP